MSTSLQQAFKKSSQKNKQDQTPPPSTHQISTPSHFSSKEVKQESIEEHNIYSNITQNIQTPTDPIDLTSQLDDAMQIDSDDQDKHMEGNNPYSLLYQTSDDENDNTTKNNQTTEPTTTVTTPNSLITCSNSTPTQISEPSQTPEKTINTEQLKEKTTPSKKGNKKLSNTTNTTTPPKKL